MARAVPGTVIVRPPAAGDAVPLRALVESAMREVPHASAARAAIERPAGAAEDPESLVLVAARDGEPVGVAVFGVVSGSRAGRLGFVTVHAGARRQGVASALVDAVAGELARRGAAMMVAELADAPALAPAQAFLARRGFAREGSVRDFYRDGVSLAIWRLDCPPPSRSGAR